MGLTSAVHWWEEWQMRVLVLSSMTIQFLLFILFLFRARAIPGSVRFIIWIAYLASDAVAIYGLATLFNRHKDQDRGGNSILEVVWAPILLIHLGGNDGITAYNIEDNELWTRHLLTAVSQTIVAVYVFCKSWTGGDKRLLQAAIVLFVPGVLKCFAKPLALKGASIKSLASSPEENEADMNPLEEYVKKQGAKGAAGEQGQGARMASVEDRDHPPPQQGSADIPSPRTQGCRRRRKRRGALTEKQNEGEMDTLEEYVKGAMSFVQGQKDNQGEAQGSRDPVEEHVDHLPSHQRDDLTSNIYRIKRKEGRMRNLIILRGEAYKLFVDLSSPYPRRLSIFKYFWLLSQEKKDEAHASVRYALSNAFHLFYTKIRFSLQKLVYEQSTQMKKLVIEKDVPQAFIFMYTLGLRVYLTWTALGLFHHSHREAYNAIDVKITYAIFCCTAVLEVISSTGVEPELAENRAWPEMVSPYSLIGYLARNKRYSKRMCIVSCLGLIRDFVDQHWCMKPCYSSRRITELVIDYLKDGWEKEIIHDAASYRRFNDNRGHCMLEKYEDLLGWSIKVPFDESVVLWYIATDICFFSRTNTSDSGRGMEAAQSSREISNYLMYLLFVNPEMLLPGTRRNLFSAAYGELNDILRSQSQRAVEEELMEKVIDTMQSKSETEGSEGIEELREGRGGKRYKAVYKENFVQDAWDLAQGLLGLGDKKMWDVIQGVWLEMLCFSAGRCRGYLHAKALGSGGEFLSYVWLLMFYMGMETFTDRLQRERDEPRSGEGNNNHASAPQASDAHNGNGTASSTSRVHTGGVTPSSEIKIDIAEED